MATKNYMEVLVDQYLQEALEGAGYKASEFCRCPGCIARMKAEALNHLKPFYITCKEGEVYGHFGNSDLQSKANIMREIVKAIELVACSAHK